MSRLTTDDRRALLAAFADLPNDDDREQDPRTFLPLPMHGRALRAETVVVLGDRGAGKTALFHLVTSLGERLGEFFEEQQLSALSWVAAFDDAAGHPNVGALDAAVAQLPAERDSDLRAFWAAHLLRRLADDPRNGVELPAPLRDPDLRPDQMIDAAGSSAIAVFSALDKVERALETGDRRVVATYDALDRIGLYDASARRRLVRGLLSLWLSASNRYRRLRAKIFLRPDLFEEAEHAFADATKLRSRAVALEWDVTSLYRLLVRHLVNGPHAGVAQEWLQRAAIGVREHPAGPEFGMMPPEMTLARQKALASAFAGEVMGAGEKKGAPYRWIPARLKDAAGRIAPRSFLRLFRLAAESARRAPPGRGPLVQIEDLTGALQETSRRRAAELTEEYAVVARLEGLRGQTMLMPRREVTKLLAGAASRGDRLSDGEDILRELCRIGVLQIRDDGRIDVPDIYRYGYDIKRKGGARQPR